ncbi:MAG: hypothetical protein HQ518_01840 [Rhodopirellula sp.]|nr:hypothetical protein [Rhodopirellula sp.]
MSNLLISLITITVMSATPVADTAEPNLAARPPGTVLFFDFEEDEDREPDGLPDDWTRRHGAGFPSYVECEIDQKHSHVGLQSLHVKVNGGKVAYYSPFNRESACIDPEFNYEFRGFIRTERLKNDFAIFTVSFLNSRRQRVQRFETRPVSGTHAKWIPLQLGPLKPNPDVRYVVIGCHVDHQANDDIKGDVWFDGIWLGKMPRLTLMPDAQDHFLTPDRKIVINAEVSGLEANSQFELHTSLSDVAGEVLEQKTWKLQPQDGETTTMQNGGRKIRWTLPARRHGCYFVQAVLKRDDQTAHTTETTLVIAEPAQSRPTGEFGWSLSNGPGPLTADELSLVAYEAGIHWIKIPVWSSMHEKDAISPVELTRLFDGLFNRSISVVGLLNDPPRSIRSQFAKDWTGTSEIFALPSDFWGPSLEPVLARYGSTIEYWQLGDDTDTSFAGSKDLPRIIQQITAQFDQLGRNSKIGVQWPWPTPYPIPGEIRNLFATIGNPDGLSVEEIQQVFSDKTSDAAEHWTMLRPLPLNQPLNVRASTLIRQMVMARLKGSRGIFLSGVLDGDRGLLNNDGAPTPLFLPFRTTAMNLSGAKHLGSFQLPESPTNYVFERDKSIIVVFPGESPLSTDLNLGDNVEYVDMWGRRSALPVKSGKHHVASDGEPIFCTGCSEAMARWRLEAGFESGVIPAEYGGHPDAIVGRNTWPQGVKGTVTLKIPRDWEAAPSSWDIELAAGESFRLPTTINLPQTASLGTAEVVLSFDITSDRRRKLDVHRSLEVGLGDVIVDVYTSPLPDGQLLIEQFVSNRTQPLNIMNFRCTLSVSGHKSQTEYVTKLGEEKDRKEYKLPNAQSLLGHELWLNLEQIGGRRNLNKRMIIGDDWKTPAAANSDP